jgi:hypothetical protein
VHPDRNEAEDESQSERRGYGRNEGECMGHDWDTGKKPDCKAGRFVEDSAKVRGSLPQFGAVAAVTRAADSQQQTGV